MTFTTPENRTTGTPDPNGHWYDGWGFQYQSPTGSVNNLTARRPAPPPPQYNPDGTWGNIDPNGQWYNGFGFQYQSPDGTVNRATARRPTAGTQTQGPFGPVTLSTADSSARAIIQTALGRYSLGSLGDWAWQKWQSGESIDQIMLELRDTTEYKARFPAMEALSKTGHALTEQQYIQYETDATKIFRAAGLPAGFYDKPDDFTKFLTNNVGTPELQDRVSAYQQAAFSAPPEVRNELQSLYGVTPGELTAFFIDPDKALPLVQKRFAAAQAAGQSDITGFGHLNQSQAEMVGDLGLTQTQLGQQFGTLAGQQNLYGSLVGTTEHNISRDTGLGAVFNQNAGDQAVIDQRKRQRLATFQGQERLAQGQEGVSGAGAAR